MSRYSLKIHGHAARFLFGKFRHLGAHHTVDSLTEVEHGRTVGGHDAGLVGPLVHDVLQHGALCGHVEGRGGLVEQEHGSVAEHGTGDGDALGLSFRQSAATLAQHAVDAVGHALYEVPGAGDAQGLDDLLVSGLLLGHAHVVGDASRKDGVALGYIGEQVARLDVQFHLSAVPALDDGLALLGFDKA